MLRSKSSGRRRARAGLAFSATLATAALVFSGCSSGGSDTNSAEPSGSNAKGDSYTIAVASPPVSLDPYLQNIDPVNDWFVNLAYDSLLRINGKGELEADLATEWKFLDDQNMKLQLTLRDGVKFSDGTPMTADGVVQSLQRAHKDGANGPAYWNLVTKISAPDDKTILFESSAPNPILPTMLTNRVLLGSVISPAGLKNPEGLKSNTFGAGPYVLDSKATVANDTYVYTPNPNYWAPEKIRWNSVKIKIVANPAAALQAVQNGDAQLTRGDSSTYAAAKQAGLHTETVALGLLGVNYADRNGELAPQLKDVRVRQALNYAMNKEAITKATFGELGKPGGQLALEGTAGFEDSINDFYKYDPAKAKKLLADAGYPDGFTIPVEVVSTSPNADILMQAVLSNWAAIGVKGKLTTYSDTGQAVGDIIAKKWPVTYYGYGAITPFQIMNSFYGPTPNQYNPWGTQDAKLTELLNTALKASPKDQDAAIAAVMKYGYEDLAWTGGVVHTSYPYISDATKITGTAHTPQGNVDVAWGVVPAK